MLFGKKKEKEQRSVLEEEQMQSPFRTIIKNLLENKLAMGGLIVFVSIFAMCFILPIWFHQIPLFQKIPSFSIILCSKIP